MDTINHRRIEVNGINIHIAEAGEGPLIVMTHGFPESWYSWRAQLPALAKAGFKAVALDMPGYGESDAPEDIHRYNQIALSDDVAAIATELGYDEFIVMGHDWGAPTAWHTALRFPERVKAVVGMSVPYGGRPPQPPTQGFRYLFKDSFFYMLYFQEVGVAEAELETDIPRFLRSFLFSCTAENPNGFDTSKFPATATLLEVMKDPERLPKWLPEDEFNYYVEQFKTKGLRGPLNYYRNLDHTWSLSEHLKDTLIECPALFLAGDKDPIPHFGGEMKRMLKYVPNIKTVTIPDCGHWTQQEQPELVNKELLEFLAGL